MLKTKQPKTLKIEIKISQREIKLHATNLKMWKT